MRTAILLFVLLAGCADRAGYERDAPHTGVTVTASSAYLRVVDEVTTIEARAVRLSRAGRESFVVKTFVLRSDRTYSKIDVGYSLGREIAYHKDDRYRRGLYRVEAGHLAMTRGEVRRRATHGYSFVLIGPRGSYAFNLPPALFAEVLG